MANPHEYNIDEATIKKLGLKKSEEPFHPQLDSGVRIFTFPNVDNAFIMESDLYGNAMPKGSCFLAFKGTHGYVGQHMTIETLKNASAADIKAIIEANAAG